MTVRKNCSWLLFALSVMLYSACKKDSFATGENVYLRISEDTLHFDTLFASAQSTTQYFLLFNDNDQKILIDNIELMGGKSSSFVLNFDGAEGTTFSHVELPSKDSAYGFVAVNILPNNNGPKPFVMRDSIKIAYNGKVFYLQLEAFGRNAYFLKDKTIGKDTLWNNKLPIVLSGNFYIAKGAKLTIDTAVNIYVAANTQLNVEGTLKALGGPGTQQIVMQGTRLDYPYDGYAGAWPGIYFRSGSKGNLMRFCKIKNAKNGAVVQAPSQDNDPKLMLEECTFDNISDTAIACYNTYLTARNCLVANSNANLAIVSGGSYKFTNCTMASIANGSVAHKNPVASISNTNEDNTQTNPLDATFLNCILYGESSNVANEVKQNKSTTANFGLTINNCLYKAASPIEGQAVVKNSLYNQNPLFDSINTAKAYYDFHLKPNSPCIGTGDASAGIAIDLDGTSLQGSKLNMGCYQRK